GDGSANLGTEMLDLRLRAQAQVIATAVVVPLRVAGPFRAPSTKADAGAAVLDNAGTVAGTVLGNATPLGLVAGALGGQKLLGGNNHVDCGPALAAARGQATTAGTAPAPQQ